MVVIVILGLLATLVVTNVVEVSDDAKIQKARTDVSSIAGAVKLYRVRHGNVPEDLEVLVRRNDEGGGNLLEDLPKDPWGNAYTILRGTGAEDWVVVSRGRDGAHSDDDIVSAKP
jgi:general secretion pathway protein G